MSETSNPVLMLFGLYELDRTGTVLYSKPYENSEGEGGMMLRVGQNIFDEADVFENGDFFRRNLTDFLQSGKALNNIVFESFDGEQMVKAKMLLTRGSEHDEDKSSAIVMMEIKKYVV